jgi:hypothetical protein
MEIEDNNFIRPQDHAVNRLNRPRRLYRMFEYNYDEIINGIYEPSLQPIKKFRRFTILTMIFYIFCEIYIFLALPESGTYSNFDIVAEIWLIFIITEVVFCWSVFVYL